MSKYSIVLLLIFLPRILFSQNAKGLVSGRVIDKKTNQPVEFATVSLFSSSDSSLVTGTVAREGGSFEISQIRDGNYYIKVSFIGYQAVMKYDLKLNAENRRIDLGDIFLATGDTDLDEFVLEEEKNRVMTSIDKKVFNVEKDLTSQGGTAVDVLENVPSITVDIDGSINLRGNSGVRVLINGRPANLSGSNIKQALEQIPASSVESVEVITNPSAKHDPDGVTGIINIVLKKNKLKGINGSINLSIGTRNKYNTSANLSYKNEKINVYANYSHNYYEGYRNYEQDRIAILLDSTNRLVQDREGEDFWSNYSLNGGLDYYISENQILGLNLGANHNSRERFGDMEYTLYDENNVQALQWNRIATDPDFNYGANAALTYEWRFKKHKGRKLTSDLSYSISDKEEKGFYTERIYDEAFIPEAIPSELQTNLNNGISGVFSGRVDFETPLNDKFKIETGAKVDLQKIRDDFRSETFNQTENIFLNDTNLTNDFEFNQDIFAAYAIFAHKLNDKFSYQAGLRAEYAVMRSILYTTDEFYEFDYSNLFPSAHFSYKPELTQELRLSYGRRINRPGSWSVNPFTKYSDPFNLMYGNPQIQPEYIHNIEASYATYLKKLTLTASLYISQTNDLIRRVRIVDEKGVSITTYANINSELSIGSEFIAMYRPKEWWNINFSGNLYQIYLRDDNQENNFNNQGFNWEANLNNSFKFKNGFSIQVSGRYRSPKVIPQGKILAIYNIDGGLQKSILNNQGSIGVRITDIFDTRNFSIRQSDWNYETYAFYKWETRVFYLNFSYRFGKPETTQKKRGGSGSSDGGGDMM